MQLLENCCLVFWRAEFEYSLDHTASKRMSSKSLDLPVESFNDKLDISGWNAFNGLLDNVVSILIFDTLQDVLMQFSHEVSLLVSQNMFQCLRELAFTMHNGP